MELGIATQQRWAALVSADIVLILNIITTCKQTHTRTRALARTCMAYM